MKTVERWNGGTAAEGCKKSLPQTFCKFHLFTNPKANAMTHTDILKITNAAEWKRLDLLDLLHTHPKFHAVAAAVIARLRRQPGHEEALQWCLANLRPCAKVYPCSPSATSLHRLFERDTGYSVDAGVFDIAAAEAGLPVDCPPGRERLRVGVHQVDVRRVERRVDAARRTVH